MYGGARMSHRQASSNKSNDSQANKLLFCDTDALETYVYSHAYFDRAPTELKEAVREDDKKFR